MATEAVTAVEAAIVNAHGKHAQAVHFLHDGKHLVSAGQDALIRIWTVPDLKPAGTLEGHKNSVNSLSFSPDEKLLLTGSTDKTVRLWDFAERRSLQTFQKEFTAVFAKAGGRFANVSLKGDVEIYDAKSLKAVANIPAPDKRVMIATFSPDGKSVLVGGLARIFRYSAADGTEEGELSGHKSIVMTMRISPDGKWMASTGADGYLRIWSTKDWKESQAVKLEGSGVFQIAWTPASDSVVVSADNLIQSYAIETGKPVERIESTIKGLYGVAVSPDGRYIANAAADGKVRIWARKPAKA